MKNLKIIREKRNLTQTQLGELIGVTQQTVQKYECGRTMPGCQTLIILAKALDTSTDYLLELTDDDAPAHHISENELNKDEAFVVSEMRSRPHENYSDLIFSTVKTISEYKKS